MAPALTGLHVTTNFSNTVFNTHNKEIAEIAEEIVQNWDGLKYVM